MEPHKDQQASRGVAWDELLARLPEDVQPRFERLLRRSLQRRLAQVVALDADTIPEVVRSQAVCQWRRRYMRDASKTARKRMGYARLRNDPTYLQIERELAQRYWATRGTVDLDKAKEAYTCTFAEACEAFRSMRPQYGTNALDSVHREACKRAIKESHVVNAAREELVDEVLRVVGTQDVSALARVMVAGEGAYASATVPFNLRDVTDKQQVLERVRDTRLVDNVLRTTYGKYQVQQVARALIVDRAELSATLVAMRNLLDKLLTGPDPTRAMLKRLVWGDAKAIAAYLQGEEFARRVVRALLDNPRYGRQYEQARELLLRVRENVPQTPMEAFPLARMMERHVTLHVGPTNSGKTHDALQALAQAASGAYLGPLRLLAYEQFVELNRMGCVCSLRTGEEAMELPGARHVSSTVEMADYETPVEVAVIDEAQMLAEPFRGQHWTSAVLGIPAREVHICCAPHAERVLRQLVRCARTSSRWCATNAWFRCGPTRGPSRCPGTCGLETRWWCSPASPCMRWPRRWRLRGSGPPWCTGRCPTTSVTRRRGALTRARRTWSWPPTP